MTDQEQFEEISLQRTLKTGQHRVTGMDEKNRFFHSTRKYAVSLCL